VLLDTRGLRDGDRPIWRVRCRGGDMVDKLMRLNPAVLHAISA
jgi:hypothetical protein